MTQSAKLASTPSHNEAASSFDVFSCMVSYAFTSQLNPDPDATSDGLDHQARQVRSGHYVPVAPTPIADPTYVAHSHRFFAELGLADDLVDHDDFRRIFSGDLSTAPAPFKRVGWATGYALSIYGTEYTQQCPFRTGNGYGDGRAISVCEVVSKGQRWEMQLKGAGPTPYCRGGDGRAVLRSSVREFLAQEFMHALGVPTSRSLTLYASASEFVKRPWYSAGSESFNPDILVDNPVAISTRVAPSFLRVGQLELFARRTRNNAYPHAKNELRMIVSHLIEREYQSDIDPSRPFDEQLVDLAILFRQRLTALVANWIRVGYCQGNFNSDNCAAGGFTLDYGPFGFCESFDPQFQPWTGGGAHFSFFNQPAAAEANFHMFWTVLTQLVPEGTQARQALDDVRKGFAEAMRQELRQTWASKLGLKTFNAEIFGGLMPLMEASRADYTIFFRELSAIPEHMSSLRRSFPEALSEDQEKAWQDWLDAWRRVIQAEHGSDMASVSARMKRVNPKYTWREWLIAPAYQAAAQGDHTLIKELQDVLNHPYDEQSTEVEHTHYQPKPPAFNNLGGISHYSCSS